MSTCGYICPICGGSGYKEDLSTCDWCKTKDVADWIEKVHEGSCCGDWGEVEKKDQQNCKNKQK